MANGVPVVGEVVVSPHDKYMEDETAKYDQLLCDNSDVDESIHPGLYNILYNPFDLVNDDFEDGVSGWSVGSGVTFTVTNGVATIIRGVSSSYENQVYQDIYLEEGYWIVEGVGFSGTSRGFIECFNQDGYYATGSESSTELPNQVVVYVEEGMAGNYTFDIRGERSKSLILEGIYIKKALIREIESISTTAPYRIVADLSEDE